MLTLVAPVPVVSAPRGVDRPETDPFVEQSVRAYAFGPFVLRPERQLLLKDGVQIRIGGRALDILTALVERAGVLVGKRELLSCVWPNTFVEEGNLKVNVASLRRTLGENPATPRYIATVVGRGYRFIAPLRYSGQVGLPAGENLPLEATRIAGLLDAIEAIRQELEKSRGNPGLARQHLVTGLPESGGGPCRAP
jgi:DNA-binding winged helix-turn-helix (wHTH) protein